MTMKSEQSKDTDQSNPAIRLARDFAGELSQARDDLLRLSNLHPDFVKQCFAAIDASKGRLQRPTLGEVFPHLVAKGLTLNDSDRRMLAAAWLAMFGYILLVDHELDQKGYLDGRASIAASALLGWGIVTGGRYVAGTPYADVFLDNVNRAFAGQYEDINVRGDANADRRRSDLDKNRAFVAAIAGFCAAARESDDRLIRCAEAMLGSFQIMDDLEDIEEDFRENNITVFVRIVKERISAATPVSRTEMYRAIMTDPRMTSTLQRAQEGLEKALLILDTNRDQLLIGYILEAREGTGALISALSDYQRDPSSIGEPELMRRIEQVATGCG
jgi:hypothetical protein